jgi:hypothetical protein
MLRATAKPAQLPTNQKSKKGDVTLFAQRIAAQWGNHGSE